ncbi:trypsin-7-like [Corticium candelabrum]|uniref:trypsin-7-like n=1 Tax=Corticium candelabrum TaxID=121492 RepID=UPI002E264175|nr:trypsin-7-like [Corticium candelabrum]
MNGIGLKILLSCLTITTSWISTAPVMKQSAYRYKYTQLLLLEKESDSPLRTEDLQTAIANDIFHPQLQTVLDDFKSQLQVMDSSIKQSIQAKENVEDNDTHLPDGTSTSVPQIQRAIFGGRDTDSPIQDTEGKSVCQDEWTAPWQVGLMLLTPDKRTKRCGGVLVHKRWVLTAAHCLTNMTMVLAMVGSKNYFSGFLEGEGQVFRVTNSFVHDEYTASSDFQPPQHDIALLELEADVVLGPDTNTAVIPERNTPLVNSKTEMVITGWGITEKSSLQPDELHCAKVPIVAREDCEEAYKKQGINIRNSHLCTGYESGGVGACNGDSGGGLMHVDSNGKSTVIGLISWSKGCGEHYSVYTDVQKHRPWILRQVPELGKK